LMLAVLLDASAQRSETVRIVNDHIVRKNSIVKFQLKSAVGKENIYLIDNNKKKYPVQFLKDGYACAIMSLNPGEVKSFKTIRESGSASKAEVLLTEAEAKFTVNGKQVIGLQTGKKDLPAEIEPVFRRGGYIFPVLSPSGLSVADDYPLNHKHHHGIWAAWTKTEFEGRKPDFWNMADKTGTVLFEGIKNTESGAVFSTLESRNAYFDVSVSPNKKVLDEDWQIKVYNTEGDEKPYYVFDLELRQQLSSASVLKLPEYLYGGVGFRGNGEWNGKDNAYFLTSEGKDRSNGHATTSKWVHISGNISGKLSGISILSHPDNFRSPQPMRIHPTEPFFCYAPSQAGDFEIRPNQGYIARYRFIVYDGAPEAAFINRMWNDYAHPLVIK
ncbi:MAG TPA: PmoA family protein, partial [Daejeonella sp.]|nr:PmoA family protein [Daejeonella sp.]